MKAKEQKDAGSDRALLVGEASTTGEPFVGRTGDRLRKVLGNEDLSVLADLVNLFPAPMEKSGKGRAFPMKAARANAAAIVSAEKGRTRFILAGKRVAAAFGVGSAEYFEPKEKDGRTYFVVPHPSGINRWWNTSGAEAEFKSKFMAFIEGGSE